MTWIRHCHGSNQLLCIYWSFFLELPPCSSSFFYSLCSLSRFPRPSLVSNLTFFLELKPIENASVWLVRRLCIKKIYIQCNTICLNCFEPDLHATGLLFSSYVTC